MAGHAVLQIVKGVQRTPGDNQSSEVGLDTIDLLDVNGFSTDAYEMKLPALKSSAMFADSPLSDGRTLISGTVGNVVETIRVTLQASTILQLGAMLSKLGRFKQDCNDFWDTLVQIEPVYIEHQVNGEPGSRYALLYDIDVAMDTPTNPSEPTRDLTIVIEREPYWRSLAPGDNPKHWSYIVNEQEQQWSAANAHLLTGVDHLVTGTVNNRAERNSTDTAFLVKNFIDIPAAKIPGDAPALVSLSVQQAVAVSATALFVGKSSKPFSGNISRLSGLNQQTVYTFNASDGGVVGADTTLAADTGAPKGETGNNQRSVTTFATLATMSTRLTFQSTGVGQNGFSSAVFRGRFAVFLRARLSAAANSVTLQVSVGQQSDLLTTTPVILTDVGAGGTGNSTDWAMVYLGELGVPINNRRTAVGPDGKGVWIGQSTQELSIAIQAARTTGAGSLYISDILFMPIDESAIQIIAAAAVGTGSVNPLAWAYDNTGYFMHGVPDDYASIQSVVAATPINQSEIDSPELSGSSLTLTPNLLNRLYFMAYVNSTKRSIGTDPSAMTVRINIVPRWIGLRAV